MERKGRRGLTSPGEERSNETGKRFAAHGSVEFCEATPVGLVGESYGTLYGHETDRGLRSVCRCVTFFFFHLLRTSRVGCAARLFILFSFPCPADHEREWPPCKAIVFQVW